jgi:acetyl-CoA C-acetyltransferase
MTMRDIYICSALRTPIGNFKGGLSHISAVELGAAVIRETLSRVGEAASKVGECIMGNVLQGGLGQAPARQAWLRAGGSETVGCTTMNRVCGSGMQAIISAARSMRNGEYDVAITGGMESMSQAAFPVPARCMGKAFDGPKKRTVDMIVHDGLWDPYEDQHMGTLCERMVREKGISREAQDDFAIRSYERALKAQEAGYFAAEIVSVKGRGAGESGWICEDEGPGLFNAEKLRVLRPVFDKKNGTITAGNASSLNDGAAALLLATAEGCERHGLSPLARIAGWSSVATAPRLFPMTPAMAVRRLLAQTGMALSDVDCVEINEAFSAVPVLAIKELQLAAEKVNPLGGAVALGHPIGASGARIVATLISSLRYVGGTRGIATLCIGGGEGVALMIERTG